jgi:16S rRNA (cytosine1402-N4)-methyltransferase
MQYHIPVLTREVLEFLAIKPHGLYVDATLGGGGHTTAILEAEPTCQVIAFDWDRNAYDMHAERLQQAYPDRLRCVWSNFAQLSLQLKKLGVTQVDGILADFGTSQYQIMHKEGFSFQQDTPLDMRMSPAHQRLTAAVIVNEAPEKDLMQLFWDYGEEPQARVIARAIVEARKKHWIGTTAQLTDIILSVVPRRGASVHPATRVFQALRIVVNKELDNINALLSQAATVLKPKGRLVCISFHSLEDRIVKQFLREHKADWQALTTKVVMAQPDELGLNPSSRSAKLRAAEKI